MPLLLALLLSAAVGGAGYAGYSAPVMHAPAVYRLVKDQSRVINPDWPVRVVKVERYTRETHKPTAKPKKKKRARHARR